MKEEPLYIELGDILVLKKPHPCGSYRWQVVKVGADIGLLCEGCGRRIKLPRHRLRKLIKKIEKVEDKDSR